MEGRFYSFIDTLDITVSVSALWLMGDDPVILAMLVRFFVGWSVYCPFWRPLIPAKRVELKNSEIIIYLLHVGGWHLLEFLLVNLGDRPIIGSQRTLPRASLQVDFMKTRQRYLQIARTLLDKAGRVLIKISSWVSFSEILDRQFFWKHGRKVKLGLIVDLGWFSWFGAHFYCRPRPSELKVGLDWLLGLDFRADVFWHLKHLLLGLAWRRSDCSEGVSVIFYHLERRLCLGLNLSL